MPLFEFKEKLAVVWSPPPFKTKCEEDTVPGAVPKLLSALMLIQPCLIVVDPVIVLAPDKVKIPEPFLIKDPSPDKFPENVELLLAFEVNVIQRVQQ